MLRPKLDSSRGSAALASQTQSILPQPEEVIAIPERLQCATEVTRNTCRVEDAPLVPSGDGLEDLEEAQALLQPDDDVVDATTRYANGWMNS